MYKHTYVKLAKCNCGDKLGCTYNIFRFFCFISLIRYPYVILSVTESCVDELFLTLLQIKYYDGKTSHPRTSRSQPKSQLVWSS